MDTIQKETTRLVEWLSQIGDDPNGGITRLLYSEEWTTAQQALEQYMKEEGFTTYYDEIGNLYGRIEGSTYPEETIMSGSHIDTVRNGGKYDGQYGILAAFMAIRALKEQHGQPLRTLEVVSFAEEEGSRFPYTFWGSKNLTGIARKEDVEGIADFNGVPFLEAMNQAGFRFRDEAAAARTDIKAFVELHIEQGSVLEHEKLSVGVVHSIVGQRRFTVEITGEANHAGTTPMGYRKDAVHAAGRMIQQILDLAQAEGDPLVTTVGKIEVKPNVVNVVPGSSLFTLDIRHTDKAELIRFTEVVTDVMHQTAEAFGVGLNINMWMDEDPVPMDKQILEVLERQCKDNNIPYKMMHSGAGHDSQILAKFAPTAMLFVPSRKGISHNPEEYTSPEHLADGVRALTHALHELAY
ncbi:allantoate deiminase [Paenibacillus sp. N1-5-1-14]|uniref:allantoate deiminase n=1 Tax=Paenibacillus radicibacter TaxID=2972488 RepID=UPI0021594033|nr:allantoate deiminase [Paenibacillus radicibacter]MCR8644766.1 allantoate deiminase [Paenibacillus radicibacter]